MLISLAVHGSKAGVLSQLRERMQAHSGATLAILESYAAYVAGLPEGAHNLYGSIYVSLNHELPAAPGPREVGL